MSGSGESRLLQLLQAHGEQFLDNFESSHDDKHIKKQSIKKSTTEPGSNKKSESEFEEWLGCSVAQSDNTNHGDESTPAVVVFQDNKPSTSAQVFSKSQKRAFMSSKASRLNGESLKEQSEDSEDEDDERTNAQNDALLHQLVHTKILSGAVNSELDMTPAQRRKALAGRVKELSGTSRLGRGERAVRTDEVNRAAKHVRDGLLRKQKERRAQNLEEAKNLGIYHPTLKKLYDDDEDSHRTRKRQRGLGSGIGKFNNGILKLTQREISSVVGPSAHQDRGGRRRKR